MASYSPTCHPTKKVGLVDIKIAVPYDSSLVALGTATDQIDRQHRAFFVDVPGSRNGGQQGPPIEIQWIGEIAMVSFSLTSYNQTAVNLVREKAMMATAGTILQSEVGTFVLTDNSMRLLLHTTDANDTTNFWCAVPREPIRVGEGVKFSEWMMSFECHRPPCGHGKANILWDRNSDAYS